MADAPAQSPEFKKAVEDVTKLKSAPSNDEKKRIYGLFKHGTEPAGWKPDDNQPSRLNFTEYGKWQGRKAVHDEGLSPEEAQAKYVELVNGLIQSKGLQE